MAMKFLVTGAIKKKNVADQSVSAQEVDIATSKRRRPRVYLVTEHLTMETYSPDEYVEGDNKNVRKCVDGPKYFRQKKESE